MESFDKIDAHVFGNGAEGDEKKNIWAEAEARADLFISSETHIIIIKVMTVTNHPHQIAEETAKRGGGVGIL